MVKTIPNPYGGFTGGRLDQVWQMGRLDAERYEIGGRLYKPTLIRFDDGELLAVPFEPLQLSDDWSMLEEHLVFFSSTDDGRTWTQVGERLSGREGRLQLLRDGTLILTCHLIGNPHPIPKDVNNPKDMTLFGCWSSRDRGRSWHVQWLDVSDIRPDAAPEQQQISNTARNVLEMPDGSFLFGVSTFDDEPPAGPVKAGHQPRRCRNWWFRSTDGGRTWCEKIPLNVPYRDGGHHAFFCETEVHRCPSGRVIAVPRLSSSYPKEGTAPKEGLEQGSHMRIYRLEDDGVTFVEEREFLDYGQLHPHLMNLPDGRLLCTYTHRNFPFGTQAVVSRDEGRTWNEDRPIMLSWFSWDSSCGFPTSVLMQDGSILTSYTTRKLHGLDRTEDELFAEVVRWRAPES